MKLETTKITHENKSMTIRWLSLADGEFFTTGDAAILLGVTSDGLRSMISKHNLVVESIGLDQRKFLQDRKVIALKDQRAKLLSRDTLDYLVKIINTPETMAMWDQIRPALRDPAKYVELQYAIGGIPAVAAVQEAATAFMSLNLAQQETIEAAIAARLRKVNIIPFDSCYMFDKWFNGTINAFRKVIIKKMAPKSLHEQITAAQLYTRVLSQGNFDAAMQLIESGDLGEGNIKWLRSVERERKKMINVVCMSTTADMYSAN